MPAFDFQQFMSHPFVQEIAPNQRWTVSTAYKMPIDIPYLETHAEVIGASFADGNQPLVNLDKLYDLIVRQSKAPVMNVAYYLQQALDDFFILDIEPKCPPDISAELLKLPYIYAEYSMSGKGYHLVFRRPNSIPVDRPELFLAKPAVKESHVWYEFLFNHYVTFTGNQITRPAAQPLLPESRLWEIFNDVSKNVKINQFIDTDLDNIPDLEDIYLGQFIVDLIADSPAVYGKTLSDFNDDNSAYEFGATGYYKRQLNSLLSSTAYERHEYTLEERIRLLYEITKRLIPYREKHEEFRYGMPWLMFTAQRSLTIVNKQT